MKAEKTPGSRPRTRKKSAAAPARGGGGGGPGVSARRPGGFQVRADLPPRTARAVRAAAAALWDAGLTPHKLLAELHDVLLLRCLDEAEGNFAAAAALFGPSRQSVQQYANSPLRDERWLAYRNGRPERGGDEGRAD